MLVLAAPSLLADADVERIAPNPDYTSLPQMGPVRGGINAASVAVSGSDSAQLLARLVSVASESLGRASVSGRPSPAPGPASHGASSCPATPLGKVVPSHLACSLRSIAIWGPLPGQWPRACGALRLAGQWLHRVHVSERTPRSSHQPSCQVHIPRLDSPRARMLHTLTARGL